MSEPKCCSNGTTVSCDTCGQNFCEVHPGSAYHIQDKWFCVLHPPPIVAKRLDSGTSYVSRWVSSTEPRKTTINERELLQKQFNEEFDRARQILRLCSKRLRDGGRVSYRGFDVELSEMSELRKGLNDKRRRFNRSKQDLTKKTCVQEVVSFVHDLQSTLPTKIRVVPAKCGSVSCDDDGCKCACNDEKCLHHSLGGFCSCQNQQIVSNLVWMSNKERKVHDENKNKTVPLYRVSGGSVDKTLSNLKSFTEWKKSLSR